MREVIPTDLLLRLLNATPEQYAAVERVLGVKAEDGGLKVEDGELKTKSRHLTPSLSPVEAEREEAAVSEDVARNAFALLQRLDADKHGRKPTLLTVFRLYCVDGMSAEQVAAKCRCSKATVINRLRFIEARTGTKAENFRAVSGHLSRLEDEFNDSRATGIYRRGLAEE